MKKINVGGDFVEVQDNTKEISFIRGYRERIAWVRKNRKLFFGK